MTAQRAPHHRELGVRGALLAAASSAVLLGPWTPTARAQATSAAEATPAPTYPPSPPPPAVLAAHVTVVHVSTQTTVLDADLGETAATLDLVPGEYDVVTRRAGTEKRVPVTLEPGQTVAVEGAHLRLHASLLPSDARFATPPQVLATTLPKGAMEFRLFLGAITPSTRPSQGTAGLGFAWGITDRLELPDLVPALAWHLGRRGPLEGVVWGGVLSLGMGFSSIEKFIVAAGFGAGVDGRWYRSPRSWINAGVGGFSAGRWSGLRDQPPDTWRVRGSLGYSHTFRDVVTLNVGFGLNRAVVWHGRLPRSDVADESAWGFAVGGTQSFGRRAAPLVQVHVTEGFTLEASSTIEGVWGQGGAWRNVAGFALDW